MAWSCMDGGLSGQENLYTKHHQFRHNNYTHAAKTETHPGIIMSFQ